MDELNPGRRYRKRFEELIGKLCKEMTVEQSHRRFQKEGYLVLKITQQQPAYESMMNPISERCMPLAVGIDSYSLHPLRLDPMATLKWAHEHGAQGVQFSGLDPEHRLLCDRPYLESMAAFAREKGLYLEWGGGQHIPYDPSTWSKKDLSAINKKAAEEANSLGTRIVRSCSGGLMRWNSKNPTTEALLEETASALNSLKPLFLDYNVVLAIETHFEFTTFELLRLFDRCGAEPGEFLGIDLDTMNLLTMLEDPSAAVDRILPWIVSTHIKDGGVILSSRGLTTFPAGIGLGVIPLPALTEKLKKLSWTVNLSIEDHGGQFHLPVFDPLFLSRFPDLTAQELARILHLAVQTEEAMRSGRCRMTERDDWPGICEKRLISDIEMLKTISQSNKAGT